MPKINEQERIEQEKRLKERISRIKHKLIVISGKGGVGKTTVAINLAYGLAIQGYRTGILDVDIHGPNIAKMLGVEGRRLTGSQGAIEPVDIIPNLKAMSISFLLENSDQPIIWRGPLKTITIKQFLSDVNWGELDYLVVDSPPGTGDEPLSVCQIVSNAAGSKNAESSSSDNNIPDGLNGAVVVTTPQDVAILDSRKSVLFARQLKMPVVGIIENMSGLICPYCGKEIDLFGIGGGEKAAGDLKVSFLGRLPIEPEIVQSSDKGKPFLGENTGKLAAKNMNEIVSKILSFFENASEQGRN